MEFWQPGCIMKVLTDKRIKTLFFEMIVCSLGFTVIAILLLVFLPENGEIYIVVCAVCMAFLFLVFCYRYFKEQNRILEEAVEQISKYIAGNDAARIACNEEGELYRLFHEVNSLAAILHAHTQKGDSIWISWKQFASIVQITIKDNGSGIHPEDLPHIFKRFYRSKFSKDTQGIGLGLPLAKAIVEAHGGTIEVDSVLAVGTTFVINLQNCRLKVI